MLRIRTTETAAPTAVTQYSQQFIVSREALGSNDVRSRLSQAVRDAHSGSGAYGYYVDHVGDHQSGDVIFDGSDGMKSVPYDFDGDAGSAPMLHMDQAKRVMQRTEYDDVPDDEDGMASEYEESMRKAGIYTELPVYERFVSKGERDKMDSSDFAGKGKSYPINKAADVMAAVRSIGRAGSGNYSADQLKKNIIRIAKRKGFTSSLPKSWQGGSSKESGKTRTTVSRETGLSLVESAAALDAIVLTEAAGVKAIPIKVIAPGKGSSAFYPAEVLKRDGPTIFKAGTQVFANHATPAEEAARPEGDVNNLAGVLLRDSEWRDSFVHKGKDLGPGLYSEVKPFSDHANLFTEKGEFLGMSIRASGVAESGKTREGVPVLKEFTGVESVDVVTKAGAGGMILTESARVADAEGDSMTDQEAKELRESNKRLLERIMKQDAKSAGDRLLEGINLPPRSKMRVIENVIERGLPLKDGELDSTKFAELIEAEAKREGAYVADLAGLGRVHTMGSPGGVDPVKAREAKTQRDAEARELRESSADVFGELMGNKEAGKLAASKGEAA